VTSWFDRLATAVAVAAGRAWASGLALLVVLVWAASGPLFHYSDTWQLFINTGTTVVTFLMVFLIQATQTRDTAAIQLKLDELVRANHDARNVFVGIDQLTAQELEALRRRQPNT